MVKQVDKNQGNNEELERILEGLSDNARAAIRKAIGEQTSRAARAEKKLVMYENSGREILDTLVSEELVYVLSSMILDRQREIRRLRGRYGDLAREKAGLDEQVAVLRGLLEAKTGTEQTAQRVKAYLLVDEYIAGIYPFVDRIKIYEVRSLGFAGAVKVYAASARAFFKELFR
ncbi:MAG: hypothetical protein HYW26_03760 [Candidatus Aenigmarchaeota archaeon]|nr:hypothetical protein [Candidatus Aenigmarchaeota archaeon]